MSQNQIDKILYHLNKADELSKPLNIDIFDACSIPEIQLAKLLNHKWIKDQIADAINNKNEYVEYKISSIRNTSRPNWCVNDITPNKINNYGLIKKEFYVATRDGTAIKSIFKLNISDLKTKMLIDYNRIKQRNNDTRYVTTISESTLIPHTNDPIEKKVRAEQIL